MTLRTSASHAIREQAEKEARAAEKAREKAEQAARERESAEQRKLREQNDQFPLDPRCIGAGTLQLRL